LVGEGMLNRPTHYLLAGSEAFMRCRWGWDGGVRGGRRQPLKSRAKSDPVSTLVTNEPQQVTDLCVSNRFLLCFETGFDSVAHVGLELMILLPPPSPVLGLHACTTTPGFK
jgi:hypothetical protein